jgi:hypothetical protein
VSWLGPDPRASAAYVPTPGGPTRAQEAQAQAFEGIAIFTASATVPPQRRAGKARRLKGELLISPDEIVFTGRGAGQTVRFAHTQPAIMLTKMRLASPWSNTRLLLEDKGQTKAQVTLSGFARHRVQRALREAGVKVVER